VRRDTNGWEPVRWAVAAAATALAMTGCGGGAPTPEAAVSPLQAAATDEVAPAFHRLPMALPPPGAGAGAQLHTPATVALPAAMAGLSTRGLTDALVEQFTAQRQQTLAAPPTTQAGAPETKPAAGPAAAVGYTPAQLRAAYQLPALPADYTSLTPAEAAALGSGSTVYIVDAYHHPRLATDLDAFSSRFGLPACAELPLAVTTRQLTSAGGACTLSVLAVSAQGDIVAKMPAYNASWAQEIALDVQWAHAVAPLARLVVIEAASWGYADLAGAITLANRLGPGQVSMSFAAAESRTNQAAAYTTALFSTAGMGYFAAAGDAGQAVNWPAVNPGVLAVGGTTLTISPSGRSESAWASTGGGLSAYALRPAYQQATLQAKAALAGSRYRAVNDVALVGNPYTGAYVAFSSPSSRTPGWYVFGGTSLGTPMWAALGAITAAQRALAGAAAVPSLHEALYGIALMPGQGALLDITSGSNGRCTLCASVVGYDLATGLGTPNSTALLQALSSMR